uniref:Putative secreted peptide n=1 Tax=Anopheles braziliensis TaxID=58242 RepID=A0A2M3ZQ79_9DIPT
MHVLVVLLLLHLVLRWFGQRKLTIVHDRFPKAPTIGTGECQIHAMVTVIHIHADFLQDALVVPFTLTVIIIEHLLRLHALHIVLNGIQGFDYLLLLLLLLLRLLAAHE